MGYWDTGFNEDGSDSIWGDQVADIMDEAIEAIVKEFKEATGRKPTLTEMQKGLNFSLSIWDLND